MCAGRLIHGGLVYPGHTNPSGLTRAKVIARFVTGYKRKQIVVLLFHRGAHYTRRNLFVKKWHRKNFFETIFQSP